MRNRFNGSNVSLALAAAAASAVVTASITTAAGQFLGSSGTGAPYELRPGQPGR